MITKESDACKECNEYITDEHGNAVHPCDDCDNAIYTLTPWGCMMAVFADYNIDWSHLTGKMGEHLVNDFMDLMQAQGYVVKHDDTDSGN